MSDPTKAVFLSYAREDTDAARRIADALRAFDVEVWFDQSELRGGDAWDAKIKKQIRECALFVPIISARTQARGEGYFRREWKLGVERTHDMAASVAFITPVVIDETTQASADVPEEFLRYQWTPLPRGVPSPQFVERVKRLLEAPRIAMPAAPAVAGAPPDNARSGTAFRSAPDSGAEAAPLHRPATPLPKPRLPGWIWATAAVAALVVGVAAFFALRPATKDPVASTPNPKTTTQDPKPLDFASAKSIAVLPFANMSNDKDSEYFSDGLTEEILNALARNPALRVAARTSSFAFKGKNMAVDEIGRALRAASVIEGSVRKSGNRVRITVQLINAADGYHVWSEAFDRELTDIFAVQDEIAAKVAQKLGGGAAPAVATAGANATVPTKNLAAYDAYLRGRAAQTSGFSEELSAVTVRHYEEAVRLDPDYALAWARLAESYGRIRSSGYDRGETLQTKARRAVAAALRLAPNLPEAHLAQALVAQAVDFDFEVARRELDRVEQLRPNDPDVPAARARVERARGNRSEAFVALAIRAVEADPQNSDTLVLMAGYLTECGRFADAERFCERAWSIAQVAEDPIRVNVINLIAWTGDVSAALALLETTPEPLRAPRFYFRRADLRLQSGHLADARADYEFVRNQMSERYRDRAGPRGTAMIALHRLAVIDARQGQPARAAARHAEALTEVDGYIRDYPDSTTGFTTRALIQATQGRRSEALASMEDAMRLALRHRDDARTVELVRVSRGAVLGALGDMDGAVAELRGLHEAGYAFGCTLRVSLDYEPLRAHAKFGHLMKEAEARANAVPRRKRAE
ncbi:MAG: TIR domain-containing protein [Verrucomicrobia bacterium]|nr:TIR domain-containing protein [Verrucomicrobiota bacterium]